MAKARFGATELHQVSIDESQDGDTVSNAKSSEIVKIGEQSEVQVDAAQRTTSSPPEAQVDATPGFIFTPHIAMLQANSTHSLSQQSSIDKVNETCSHIPPPKTSKVE